MARLSRWTANVSPVASTPGEECLGAIAALHDTPILLHVPVDGPFRSCMSDNFTVDRVVVHRLDRHPQRLQENFVKLAMPALHEAWPCAE